jgi:DNA mismatch repair protein MutL
LTGIIKLLSDAVANQIAAGEVVQRPSSIVKELLENSIDAGADHIKLLIKDGGSTLVQVIDNGKGMSETDARMCWERHATSKINRAEDLFSLHTYGFRGEAMASIAAVAQVEMKTKRKQDEVGTLIRIEASEIKEQSICSTPFGTSIAVKNLFYNIPARRNFLKSLTVETKHIFEEFQRQTLANPQISFQLFNQNQLVYDLPAQSLKERTLEIWGRKKNHALIPVDESTEIIEINGFIGSPESAKKTRGDQYFFVNNRFIKSPYFHHAIAQAFEGILQPEEFPSYILFLKVLPEKVDVNVHPTKTEVKFEDEKHIYNILKATARKALNQFLLPQKDTTSATESLGNWLQNDTLLRNPNWSDFKRAEPSPSNTKNHFNPFQQDTKTPRYQNQDWQKILGPIDTPNTEQHQISSFNELPREISTSHPNDNPISIQSAFQLNPRYAVANLNQSLYIVDIKRTHQHLAFNRFLHQLELQKGHSQQLLFPRNIELKPAHLAQVLDILDSFHSLGFDLSHFGGNTLIINGLPAQLPPCDEQKLIEKILDDYEQTAGDVKLNKNQALALSMSRHSTQHLPPLKNQEELIYLLGKLFQQDQSAYTFDGKQIYVTIGADSIFEWFDKKRKI